MTRLDLLDRLEMEQMLKAAVPLPHLAIFRCRGGAQSLAATAKRTESRLSEDCRLLTTARIVGAAVLLLKR